MRARAADVRAALRRRADPKVAAVLARFFKTGAGEYGHGDVFLGLKVPTTRAVIRPFLMLPPAQIGKLLRSRIHEERLAALLILVERFRRGDDAVRRGCFDLYLANRSWINNWDLVDCSAEHIVGGWLRERDRGLLDELARSKGLWDRRIAIISTFEFIKRGEHRDTFRIARALLRDEHDLIHKAVGWMLREVGKRVSPDVLRSFLTRHATAMPRTALRYAIERFDAAERARWLGYRGASGG